MAAPFIRYFIPSLTPVIGSSTRISISDAPTIWDISEFFVMKKYKRHGIGTAVAHKIWDKFKGLWQVRVLVNNQIARAFWLQAINMFTLEPPVKAEVTIKEDDWIIYTFESTRLK